MRQQPKINLAAALDVKEKQGTRRGTASVSEQLRTTSTDMSHREMPPRLSKLSHTSIGHGGWCNSAHHNMFISTERQERDRPAELHVPKKLRDNRVKLRNTEATRIDQPQRTLQNWEDTTKLQSTDACKSTSHGERYNALGSHIMKN